MSLRSGSEGKTFSVVNQSPNASYRIEVRVEDWDGDPMLNGESSQPIERRQAHAPVLCWGLGYTQLSMDVSGDESVTIHHSSQRLTLVLKPLLRVELSKTDQDAHKIVRGGAETRWQILDTGSGCDCARALYLGDDGALCVPKTECDCLKVANCV